MSTTRNRIRQVSSDVRIMPSKRRSKHNEPKKAFTPVPLGLEHALRVANGIPVEWRAVAVAKLMNADWSNLRCLITVCSEDLQAFCFYEGVEIKGKEYFVHPGVRDGEDLQVALNIMLLQEGKKEVARLIADGLTRMDTEAEEKSPLFRWLVDRVRERLLLAFAVRQLIHEMAHPNQRVADETTDFYNRSSWSWARFRIRDGKAKFEPSLLIRLLDGLNVERVRECPICSKYFWAGRINMKCCSTQHSNTLRMREYRRSDKL